MGAASSVLSGLVVVAEAVKERAKDALQAPHLKEGEKPRLRVGLGGDIPVFPPIFALLSTLSAGAAWAISGERLAFVSKLEISYPLPARLAIAAGVLLLSSKLKAACDKALVRAGTEFDFKHVPSVADTGPYAYCRHSMYIALSGLPTAVSVALDCGWILGAAALTFLYCALVVLPPEEAFLVRELGDEYRSYMKRVPFKFLPLSKIFCKKKE